MKCEDLEQLSSLYVYDELPPGERRDFEGHLAGCDACRRNLAHAQRLDRFLRQCPEPEVTPDLLARCRASLDDALDREQLGWRAMLRGWLWSFGPLPVTRAAAVLTLVVFGFGLGWTLRPRVDSLEPTTANRNASAFNAADLNNLRIRSITQVAPGPQSGGVRITLDAERRVTLEGSMDDPRIRRILVDTMKGYENPGIRRDTLDILRMRTHDPSVREALMYALHDGNVGVRLEALKTVQTMECGVDTHEGLIKVMESDPNAGIRTAAIDALVQHLEEEGTDETVLEALERLANHDQNPHVRMRSLAALRKLRGME